MPFVEVRICAICSHENDLEPVCKHGRGCAVGEVFGRFVILQPPYQKLEKLEKVEKKSQGRCALGTFSRSDLS